MAGIKSAREDYESEKVYLSNSELIDQQVEFCVLSAALEEGGQYGPVWRLMIVYLDENGEHIDQSVFLSAGGYRNGTYKENAYRKWFFTKKASYPLHHVILTQGVAANGKNFNDIDDAPASIDPCPCMTGDYIASLSKGLLHKGTVTEPDDTSPESDNERPNLIEGIFKLSNTMGWPFDAEALGGKEIVALRKMYRNLGRLANQQR